jgi:hypothetical protein
MLSRSNALRKRIDVLAMPRVVVEGHRGYKSVLVRCPIARRDDCGRVERLGDVDSHLAAAHRLAVLRAAHPRARPAFRLDMDQPSRFLRASSDEVDASLVAVQLLLDRVALGREEGSYGVDDLVLI